MRAHGAPRRSSPCATPASASRRQARVDLRDVLAGRSDARALAGRPRHRAHAGPAARADARRAAWSRASEGAAPRQRVHGAAAARLRGGAPPSRRSSAAAPTACAASTRADRRRQPRRRIVARDAARARRPRDRHRARRPDGARGRRAATGPTSCCSTSGCPGMNGYDVRAHRPPPAVGRGADCSSR